MQVDGTVRGASTTHPRKRLNVVLAIEQATEGGSGSEPWIRDFGLRR